MDNILRLVPHPDGAIHSVNEFQVGFSINHEGQMWLRYHVDCEPSLLTLDEPQEKIGRADRLWETTCFEVFLKKPGEMGYLELNFSTARKWAAYSFEKYRGGMRNQRLVENPEIYLDGSDSHIALEVTMQLPSQFSGEALDMGIAAIIEEKGDTKSYWALAHPPGKPDFHHEACFAFNLAAPVIP